MHNSLPPGDFHGLAELEMPHMRPLLFFLVREKHMRAGTVPEVQQKLKKHGMCFLVP